jgi:hypothetical protein
VFGCINRDDAEGLENRRDIATSGRGAQEYFLVAIPGVLDAETAVRTEKNLHPLNSDVEIVGEASPEILAGIDLEEGQILPTKPSEKCKSAPATASGIMDKRKRRDEQ